MLGQQRLETSNVRQLASVIDEMNAAAERVRTNLIEFDEIADDPRELEAAGVFHTRWRSYEDSLAQVWSKIDSAEVGAAIELFETHAVPAFGRVRADLDALHAIVLEEGHEVGERMNGIMGASLVATLAALAGAVLLGGIAVVWLSSNVIQPILHVSDAMRRLTAGDQSVEIADDRSRQDEVGALLRAASGYRESLLNTRHFAEIAGIERERLEAAVENMPIGLVMFDADKRLIISNACYAEMYRLPPELVEPGASFRAILDHRVRSGVYAGEDGDKHRENLVRIVEAGAPYRDFIQLRDGRIFSLIFKPLEGGGWVSTHEDVTDRRKAEAKIAYMAHHDALTDLPNRVLFRERVKDALTWRGREDSVAVLCLDLDQFKEVNDTLGHPVGDELLKQIGQRLLACVREGDTVARLGGDEFAILHVGAEQPMGARMLSQRLIESVKAPCIIDGHQVVVGVSIGIALAPADGENADLLLKNGDMALYRAKADGRGIYRFFEAEMDARMQARRRLELDLRAALAAGEFELFYQPQINLTDDTVVGFEALLRWRHHERGLMPPMEFIPVAEETGLIIPIGEWVLKRACHDAASWPRNVNVAVNLSPVQFRSAKLTQAVVSALESSRLLPSRLELEITESVLLNDNETVLNTLHQLRELGVAISMDDFGTGYSSLSYLQSFPFNKIKIDRRFVTNINEDPSSLAIVRAVTGLSASLGITTTAEGVETKEQLDRVRAEGCTEVQGFYTGRPMRVEETVGLFQPSRQDAAVA
jgi:diguanylate cyclase (GGDEF)-like protein